MKKKYKIGVDEAGRGPWFGPVCAVSLAFNPENLPDKKILSSLNDSKKLTEKKREEIFKTLINEANKENPTLFFGIGLVDNYVIDEINIRMANKEAMKRALEEIFRKIGKDEVGSILIDGRDNYVFGFDIKPTFIVGGDAKVLEISAASIIAKVFRDKMMSVYAEVYPNLGLEKHKGYGTKLHQDFLTDSSKVTSFHRKSYKPIKEILDKRPKLLLHVCCAPDVITPLLDLKNEYDITCFWYDPNIFPEKEYKKRFQAFKKVCKLEKIPLIEGDYEPKKFLEIVKGLENEPEMGERCHKCYDFRLLKTAELAKKLGFEFFTTTLTTSPHKDAKKIFCIGEKIEKETGIKFLPFDFKKNFGFERSVEYTKKFGIYRQNYCGCPYSQTYPFKAKNEENI